MTYNDVLNRLVYVRNSVNLSARELSLRIGMSPQYIAQIERGRIVLTVEKLLTILEICNFPIERFFSSNIEDYLLDSQLEEIINSLSTSKKKSLIDFLK